MRHNCSEKILCDAPNDNPLTSFNSAWRSSPVAHGCRERILCNPSFGNNQQDNPIMNLSSERVDTEVFVGWTWRDHNPPLPPLGDKWWAMGCTGICESTISQADADACAARSWEICFNNAGGWIPNVPQTCIYTCADGSTFSYTTPAGMFYGKTQYDADFLAHAYACGIAYQTAKNFAACFALKPGDGQPPLPDPPDNPPNPLPPEPPTTPQPLFCNTPQSCKWMCSTGVVQEVTVPACMFLAPSVEQANNLASEQACREARILCGRDGGRGSCREYWNQEVTETVTCCDGSTRTATLPAHSVGECILINVDPADAQRMVNDDGRAVARNMAQALCCFCNSAQTAPCPPGTSGTPGFCPAGLFISNTSQADADAQALAYAKDNAQCSGCVLAIQDLWDREHSYHGGGSTWVPSGSGGARTGSITGTSGSLSISCAAFTSAGLQMVVPLCKAGPNYVINWTLTWSMDNGIGINNFTFAIGGLTQFSRVNQASGGSTSGAYPMTVPALNIELSGGCNPGGAAGFVNVTITLSPATPP